MLQLPTRVPAAEPWRFTVASSFFALALLTRDSCCQLIVGLFCFHSRSLLLRESVCCLLVLNSVTSTPQWIMPARGRVGVCVVFVCKYVLGHSRVSQPLNLLLCLLRHFGFLTSPHASPTCRRRRLNSYRLFRRSTPGPPPNLRAHFLHLPSSPRPPLYTPTITT